MKNYVTAYMSIMRIQMMLFLLVSIFILIQPGLSIAQQEVHKKEVLPAEATSATVGKLYGIQLEIVVNGPGSQETPLQVACVFEYTEGDIFNSPPALPAGTNGMVNLDKALGGLITDLRKSGKFAGYELETLLIMPPPGTIKAKKLLLIGLGDRNKFSPDLMRKVGAIGLREALRLGVNSYAYASDLKDAGIDSPTGLVVSNVVTGTLEAYKTQQYLRSRKAYSFRPLVKFTLLSGQAYFSASKEAMAAAIKTFNNN